jgi:hypothetical protein
LRAVYELTILGEYEKTYPVYLKLINSDDDNDKLSALLGLAAIGSKDALQILLNETKNKSLKIKQKAESIISYIKMKRREKCGQ